MKKLIFLIAIVTISMLLSAGVEINGNNDRVQISIQDNDDLKEKKITRVVALPSRAASVQINYCEVEVLDRDGNLLEQKTVDGSEYVRIEESFVLRELFAHQIDIDLESKINGNTSKVKNLEFEIIAEDKVQTPTSVSRAFLPIYRSLIDNFDYSYLNDLLVAPAKMLILSHNDNGGDIFTNLHYYTDWKNAKGIETEVVDVTTIAANPTNEQIKDFILNAYNTWEKPPAYVVLIGDVSGANPDYVIPSYTIHSGAEDDVTDFDYTLLEGDDYFPEMIIGRISVDELSELQTVISKVLKYEKEPYMGQTHWFENATLVAGNFSNTPIQPTTPVKTMMWLRDKMDAYGYNNIDEIYFWPPYYEDLGSLIAPSIDLGVGIVAYRGWGDANGWQFPRFVRDDMEELNNGRKLPIMTSFVCNTGDFANNVDPCFGEKWVSMGSINNPKGGVVFTGPSDLHTKTMYNNSIFSGFYAGLLDEGIHSFGAAMIRARWELWNNFPLNRQNSQEEGAYVRFYFHVYNILGDPSIDVWTTVPQAINCTLPSEITLGTNYLVIDADGLDDAVVTAIKGDEIFSTEIIEDGSATLYFNSQSTGNITITITKPNYYPFIQTIDVIQEGIDVGLEEVSTASAIVAGETMDLQIELHNFGSEVAVSVSADLSTDNPHVNVITTTASYGDIASGTSTTQSYEVEFLAACHDNESVEFDLAISTSITAKFEIIVSGLLIEFLEVVVNDENGILDPMEESDITVTLQNPGSFNTTTLTAELIALNSNVSVTTASCNLGSINMNETGLAEFTISLNDESFVGENLQFRVDVTDANNLLSSTYFSLEAGDVNNYAPTGPDGYGYYAYDSRDGFYQNSPTYEWIEIDPQEGGSGEVRELGDDRSFTIENYIDFKYYGEVTDSITICTNGWISMQPTWETYFRNWTIPSALGGYGAIMPFWDDMVGPFLPGSTEDRYDMRICYYHDVVNHRLIVEWNECVNREDNISLEKFEIVLYDQEHYGTATGDGIIQFNYQTVSNIDFDANYATVGIENFQQNDGLLYSFADIYPASASELQNEFSIKFTTDAPVYSVAAQPTAEFSVDYVNGIVPYTIKFNNDTTPMYYFNTNSWDFGDGSTSVEFEPEYTYDEVGEYTVTLIVTNSEGTDTIVKESYIDVLPPLPPVADFSVEHIAGFPPFEVEFDNLSTPLVGDNGYEWSFGDSTNSVEFSPTHIFDQSGVYTISLKVTNSAGEDEMNKENYIIVIDESEEIWPGDTNSDGNVDEADILPIGFYLHSMGSPREEVTFNWQSNIYPLGWNIAVAPYADCNGDGEVDIADVLGICLNWDQTHPVTISFSGEDDLEEYRENFQQLYNALNNNGTELLLKNHIAELYGFPIVAVSFQSMLDQNYPNPFNPTTSISYSVAESGRSELTIFNIKGQQVSTLVKEMKQPGVYEAIWNGKDKSGRKVSSGLYFYRLKNNNKTIDTKKMLLLK